LHSFLIDDLTRKEKKHRIFRILLLVFLFLNVILLSARTALFTCFITGIAYSVIVSAHRKVLKHTYKTIIAVVILLTAAGVYSNIFYNRWDSLLKPFKEVKSENKVEKPQTEESYNSISIRVELWKDSWELIKQNIFFGVGTGDIKDILEKKYAEKKFYYGATKKFNPHNQFLHTGVTLGLMGVTVLLLMLILPGLQSLKTKNYLFISFSVVVFLNCMTESILEVQKGVLFFCVFSLLLFHPHKESAL
jgi:O-antigen ligase